MFETALPLKKIILVAGARPNFMKIAPIIEAIQNARKHGAEIEYALIHTGQHYDAKMSHDFFLQLNIPEPDHNLESGGGTQTEQTASIMVRFEKYLSENRADLVMVVGDVTSTLACSIVAKKLGIPVAHVEGGIRSGDMTMPEEINRIVTDSIADYFFTTTISANENLMWEGKRSDQLFFVGNTMIDTLNKNLSRLKKPSFWDADGLKEKEYVVLTLHRPSNVDSKEQLSAILQAVQQGTNGLKIVFSVHPRTRKNMEQFGLQINSGNVLLVDPQGYLEFNFLVKNSRGVITDSGGITEETTVLGIPCITLRTSTERPETCTVGTNELIGTDPIAIPAYVQKMIAGNWKKGGIPELWDGHTAARIVQILVSDILK